MYGWMNKEWAWTCLESLVNDKWTKDRNRSKGLLLMWNGWNSHGEHPRALYPATKTTDYFRHYAFKEALLNCKTAAYTY